MWRFIFIPEFTGGFGCSTLHVYSMKSYKMLEIEKIVGQDIEKYLKHQYIDNMLSTVKISKKIGVNHATIINWMKFFGINRRTNSESNSGRLNHQYGKHNKILYSSKNDFFRFWSKDMAWVLGFICSDGNIENKYVYSITQKDSEPLEKIKTILNYSGPLTKSGKCMRLRVGNFEHVQDLNALGVYSCKSLILKMPQIPKEYMWHFIRGYFDGDGSVYFVKNFSKGKLYIHWRISFIGSYDFIESLNEFISEEIQCKMRKPYNNGKVCTIVYEGKNAINILEKLYDSSSEQNRLNRKYIKYLDFAKFMEKQNASSY
jgi:hypothetical protein